MNAVELLTVEASFTLSEWGIVLVPDFPVPDGWKDRTETVTVVQPNGEKYDATIRLSKAHFNIPDPRVSLEKRWRVVARLPNWKKEVPVGSKILVSQEVRDAILPPTTT